MAEPFSVPSDAGILWFEALCPSMSSKPALHELLARLAPDDVDRRHAIDVRHGWMITSERGATLGDSLEWEPIRDAYAERWGDIVSGRSLNALWEATAVTQPVNRAQTWADCLDGVTDQELADRGIAPLHHLRRVLDA